MSDTPETDAAKFTTYSTRHLKYIHAVQADFARAQERRIAELESRLELWGTSAAGERVRVPDHLDGITTRDETIMQLDQRWREEGDAYIDAKDRIERLEKICAAAYQLAGIVGAPVRFLDALALHDDVDVDSLLPVTIDEFESINKMGAVDPMKAGPAEAPVIAGSAPATGHHGVMMTEVIHLQPTQPYELTPAQVVALRPEGIYSTPRCEKTDFPSRAEVSARLEEVFAKDKDEVP